MSELVRSEFIQETKIPGLLVIERPTFADERGFFHEIARVGEILDVGGQEFKIVQMSHAMSKPGVIRAIHTEGWNKLIYPITGKMFAAIVDVRPDSPTFGKYEIFEFDNETEGLPHRALFLPKGMGNSVCVTGSQNLHYFYAVDEYWDNSKAQGIAWDDPDLAIPWPVKDPIISDRDRNNPTLRQLFPQKFT